MSDKPKYFYQTDRGKIISHGVHEHNGAIGLMKGVINIYRNDKYSKEEALDLMEKAIKRAQDSMDFIYKKIKEFEGY